MKLTDYFGVYGAVLSTAVFVWNIIRARAKFKVKVTFAFDDDSTGIVKSGIGIFVQNPSAHTVHITNISFTYPWQSVSLKDRIRHTLKFRTMPIRLGWCHTSLSNYGVDDRCPVSIEPGQSHYVFVEQSVVDELLKDALARVLIAEVQDALWRQVYSARYGVVPPRLELVKKG